MSQYDLMTPEQRLATLEDVENLVLASEDKYVLHAWKTLRLHIEEVTPRAEAHCASD